MTRFPNPLLTAINIEVQRFNSKMILERQPHQIDLIEPAFVKCKAEVARKKIEASKSLQRISYRGVILDDDNAVAAYMGPIASSNEEQVVIQAIPRRPNPIEKLPPDPDPPKVNCSPKHPVPSDVPVVEHPLARMNIDNSQIVSTPTRTLPRVLNPMSKRAAKGAPHHALGTTTKDPAAMHWDPPAD